MFVFEAFGISVGGILKLQEVRLGEVDAPACQQVGVFFFVSLAGYQVKMVFADGSIISQHVFNQSIGIRTASLGEAFVALGQIDTIALYPCGNPGEVLAMGFAVREIDFIVELVILAVNANHLQEIHIGRSCSYEAVHAGVALQQIVDQQGVGSRNVTMYSIVVNTIAVRVIVEVIGDTYQIVKYPSRVVIGFDGGLHQQSTTQHIGYVAIQTLNVFGSV